MTARIDVTALVGHSKRTGTKFYINFLYLLSKVLNSRDDYKMGYLWQSDELICYDSINPIQYVFHEDTETCTPVYSFYSEDYEEFYRNAANDVENLSVSYVLELAIDEIINNIIANTTPKI
jgi:chloramphenicol O-acetyltransferase type A